MTQLAGFLDVVLRGFGTVGLAAAAPLEDTLATRQPEEYAWSEYNHHAAGFFVFTMGLLALLDRTGRAPWARHWPLGFLGRAAFLFVRNDPRAWPLGPAGFPAGAWCSRCSARREARCC